MVRKLQDAAQPKTNAARPDWMASLTKELAIQDLRSVGYINLSKVYGLALELLGEEATEFKRVAEVLGLHELESMSSATGYEGEGQVQHVRLAWRGVPRGILAMVGQEPLNPKSLEMLPADTLFATSLRWI